MKTFLSYIFAVIAGFLIFPAFFTGNVPCVAVGTVFLLVSLVLGPNEENS